MPSETLADRFVLLTRSTRRPNEPDVRAVTPTSVFLPKRMRPDHPDIVAALHVLRCKLEGEGGPSSIYRLTLTQDEEEGIS